MDVRVRKDNQLSRAYTQGGIQSVQKKTQNKCDKNTGTLSGQELLTGHTDGSVGQPETNSCDQQLSIRCYQHNHCKGHRPRNEPTHTVNNESGK